VTVFEKDNKPGGLLRYGIPNFKLSKHIIDRRLKLLMEEGIEFVTNTEIGRDIPGSQIMAEYDAVCLTIGAGKPRDITPPGRDLKGIYFAMDFLSQQIRVLQDEKPDSEERISAKISMCW